jgi:hypothetical protein
LKDRREYFKEYNKKRRDKQLKYFREKYLRERKERLTKAHSWYILNREAILAKLKSKSLAFTGHAHLIWKAIKKYAKEWDLALSPWDEFKLWTIDDPTYEELFNAWKESGYQVNLSPVVMRGVKKNGFIVENLKWDKKGTYSWWSEEYQVFKEIEQDLDKLQRERNQRSKEWRKKVREEWKAKRKGK